SAVTVALSGSCRAGLEGGEAGGTVAEALRERVVRRRSSGVMGPRAVPGWVGRKEGMPTGDPQRGQTVRRDAISSRARRCLPQLQINLIVISRFSLAPRLLTAPAASSGTR